MKDIFEIIMEMGFEIIDTFFDLGYYEDYFED